MLFGLLLPKGSQDFDFFNVLGAENLSYVKSIETQACAFLPLNISAISSVSSLSHSEVTLLIIHEQVLVSWFTATGARGKRDRKRNFTLFYL